MQASRFFYSQKYLLNLTSRLSANCSLCPKIFPQFHRTIHTTSRTQQYNHSISAVYDPITGSLSTRRDIGGGDEAHKRTPSVGDDNSTVPSPSQDYLNDALSKDNRSYGSVKKTSGSQTWRSFGASSGSKKKGKVKISWVCENCGYSDGQWWGSCRSCNSAGTMKRFSEGDDSAEGGKKSGFQVSENMLRSWSPQQSVPASPIKLTEVNRGVNQMEWRIPLIIIS